MREIGISDNVRLYFYIEISGYVLVDPERRQRVIHAVGNSGFQQREALRGGLKLAKRDRDGFLREWPFDPTLVALRPVSLPSTEDAKFCREDHDESRKSAAPFEDEEFAN